MAKKSSTNLLVKALLNLMALNFNLRPGLRKYLKSADGWMDFSVGFRTADDSVAQTIRFREGRAKVVSGADADTTLNFRDDTALKKMLKVTPNELFNMLMTNEMFSTGNMATMNKFNFLLSLLLEKQHKKMNEQERERDRENTAAAPGETDPAGAKKMKHRFTQRLRAEKSDAVVFLDDPYLSEFSLDDFPRVKDFLDIHFTQKPEVCPERPKLLTNWHREHGFEVDKDGKPWVPELRQALAFKHLMENRKPIIRKNDLIAGTTTTKDIGVVIYPDAAGTIIWGELKSVPDRILNPYDVSEETLSILHNDVFPYWEKRNFREWVREKYGEPISQQMDERFAVYFLWKTVAISHTIADFPKLLALGTSGMIDEIRDELSNNPDPKKDNEKQSTLEAMIICLEGIDAYSANLAEQAKKDAEAEIDPERARELEEIAKICERVPRLPARTLHEALNSIWIGWISLHMESTNAGLSLGRMDQWLQPFFVADMEKFSDPTARKEYVKRAVELVGCFYMRCTDHLPLVPDIGNFLFGGSSSGQVITLGGTATDGSNGVNDMTYIFLKVTEMLSMRDPNMNARYDPEINSDTYLKRLCEVNVHTSATPSMHNEAAVMASLTEFNYPDKHLRDWAATGCVEPTLSGKHFGHTNCMMMNMVAALEMAMNNGRHPLMNWEVGPKTGDINNGGFETFEDFYCAFEKQYRFLIEQSCEYNNMLGIAHGEIRPTPLLSAMIDGCMQKGKDVTKGGALYNTSGAACIGLADITDSLMAIKKLVYDEKKITLPQLKKAVDEDFANDPALHSMLVNKAPKFGSGDKEALAMAERVTKFSHDEYGAIDNYRGGKYTAGFWSMSNHVAFGTLSGALPSGRPAWKPFTPGLTPAPEASDNLLAPIHDVAALKHEYMNNNIAFNVKVVPGADDSHGQTVDNVFSYVKTYFDLGGMQMQLNVVTSAILRDAMKNPDGYRNLIVRISGYNAYFVTLNRELQKELIERAEYSV